MHLWYLLVLFLFTLLFAPLFRWLRHGFGRKLIYSVGNFLALPGMIYLLALPIFILMNLLNPNKGIGELVLGGWSFLLYVPFYLAGFVIYSHDGLLERVKQLRWLSLAGGLLSLFFLLQQISGRSIPLWGTDRIQQLSIVYCLNSWFWILAFLGFAQKDLAFNTPYLKYANEAVLPFYIMHQTVLLCVGYFVIRWSLPDGVAYLVIAAVSLTIIMSLYEFLIRRFNLLRFFFGMKLHYGEDALRQGEPAFKSY